MGKSEENQGKTGLFSCFCRPFADELLKTSLLKAAVKRPCRSLSSPPQGKFPTAQTASRGVSSSELATQGSAGQKMLAEIPHFPFDFRHPKRWEKHNSSASLPVLLSWMGKRPSRTAGLPLVGKSISEGVDMLINTSLSFRLIPLVSEHLH